jgi:hypothetical protein
MFDLKHDFLDNSANLPHRSRYEKNLTTMGQRGEAATKSARFTTETRSTQSSESFLSRNSLLRALRVSAVRFLLEASKPFAIFVVRKYFVESRHDTPDQTLVPSPK